MKKIIVLVCMLAASTVHAQLSFQKIEKDIVITSTQDQGWSATVCHEHGGVISRFHLPAGGPNLVADDSNPFRGLFTAFYCSDKIHEGDHPAAKGTLWNNGKVETLDVISATDDEIVVKVQGTGYGWRLLGPADEPVGTYSQTYIFRSDRIMCEGQFDWVYGNDSRLKKYALVSFFQEGVVAHPVCASGPDFAFAPLEITSSKGGTLPQGLEYPVSARIQFANGSGIRIHTREIPTIFRQSREYGYERPWQQEWAVSFALAGVAPPDSGLRNVSYSYEIEIEAGNENKHPIVKVDAPERETRYNLGDEVIFRGKALDAEGNALPESNLRWEIFYHWSQLAAEGSGATFAIKIPEDAEKVPADPVQGKYVWACLTATDSKGRIGKAYTRIYVDVLRQE